VFVYIEGEGTGSPYDVVSGEHVDIARVSGALVVALEHRYYGASYPVQDMTTPNMRFLSSQQQLADWAEFIGFLRVHYNLTTANRLIVYGGSYAGAMTSWLRLKYPHLVYAAVSSSGVCVCVCRTCDTWGNGDGSRAHACATGPVHAIADFTGYNDVIAASLADPIVGGSSACTQNVQAAFAAVATALATPAGRTNLSTDFLSCQPLVAASDNLTMTVCVCACLCAWGVPGCCGFIDQ
jgi:serine protease 16